MTDNPTRCAMCGGPWHQATGMMVGHPSEFPVCGRCMVDVMATIKGSMEREIRVSTRAREEWKATPKADRGPRPWVSFYEHAETSIGAARRDP